MIAIAVIIHVTMVVNLYKKTLVEYRKITKKNIPEAQDAERLEPQSSLSLTSLSLPYSLSWFLL